MSTNNYQVNNDRFLYYQRQFGEIAKAGINSDDPLRSAAQIVQSVDTSSFTPSNYDGVLLARDSFIQDLIQTAEQVDIDSRSLVPMQPSFQGLASHIRTWTGDSLDTYITDAGIQVTQDFADISSLCGEPISSENIEEE